MVIGAALCLAAGGGDSGGNAAAGKTFSYGAPVPYGDAGAAAAPVQSALALQTAPDATDAQTLASTGTVTSSLLGSSVVMSAGGSGVQQRAFALATESALTAATPTDPVTQPVTGFDDSSCVRLATGSVTFDRCTVTLTESTTSSSSTSKVELNGQVAYDATKRTTTWGLDLTDAATIASGGQTANVSLHLHEAGDLAFTDTTVQGKLLAELSASGSSGGQSATVAVSEAVLLDVTYADAASCASRVTGGTLEAKRVWTDRGTGSATNLPDRAALVTWTGCGVATVAYSP
jgi:hypothetical protein